MHPMHPTRVCKNISGEWRLPRCLADSLAAAPTKSIATSSVVRGARGSRDKAHWRASGRRAGDGEKRVLGGPTAGGHRRRGRDEGAFGGLWHDVGVLLVRVVCLLGPSPGNGGAGDASHKQKGKKKKNGGVHASLRPQERRRERKRGRRGARGTIPSEAPGPKGSRGGGGGGGGGEAMVLEKGGTA